MYWMLQPLRKYFDFMGRARRTEFWMFVLFTLILGILVSVVDSALGLGGETGLLTSIYGLALIIPYFAVTVRRLHDTGRSAWWLLVSLIPIIGFIALFVFMVLGSNIGDNKYGASPK